MIIELDVHDHSCIPIHLNKDEFKELLKFLKSNKDKSISYIQDGRWKILSIESYVGREEEGMPAQETAPGLDAF